MTGLSHLKNLFIILVTALAVAACSDSSTEIASPGNTGPNPGTGGGDGGTDGGNGGGGGGSAGNCPTGTTAITVSDETHCQLSGTITQDLTLTSDNIYTLNGSVFVGVAAASDGTGGTPVTLTIEPGTVIYGETLESVLIITRGSQIDAAGSANEPIIFTSSQDLGFAADFGLTQRAIHTGSATTDPNTSEWGGLVINGLATLNNCDTGICEAEGEGDSGFFGGNDDTDSSGTLRFVVVKYAGNPITATDELNGIAFQGVGSGTTVDFVQVHNGADDGVEFFGGTVNAKHLIVTGADDDSVDWTLGWRGKLQHVLVSQNPNQPASDRGIEADNFEFDNDATPRSAPMIANMTLIGGAPDVGDTGMVIRRGSAGNFFNIVATGWRDACFDLDDEATFTVAGADASTFTGDLTIQSALFDCDDATDDEDGDPFVLETWFLNQDNNVIGSSSLSGFVNGAAEAAVTATDVSQEDPFFDAVDHIGAVEGPAAPENWTLGWSFGLNADPSCPDVTGVTETTDGCVLEGTITEDLRLVAGLDYFLRGSVFIGEDEGPDPANPLSTADPATLTIDAGVEIFGEDSSSVLVISRGSRIIANGTRTAPVVMTAVNDASRDLDLDTGLWGGLVINGQATLNNCDTGICEAEGEGDSGMYGGNDDTDDSGQLFFLVVKFAGNPITATDELNGIAFQGVGSGTEVDFIQVHNNADDGVEFFGGTVSAKHVVITGADDDSVDWTLGWRGKLQHVLVVQNPNQPASDRGIEADNFEFNNDATPRAAPMISNITFVGGDPDVGDTGIVLRRGTAARLFNVVATGWRDACFDIDDDATFTVAGTSATSRTGDLTIESALLDCADATDDEDGDPYDLETWFLDQANNSINTANTLQAPSAGGKAYINGANEAAVTARDTSAVDAFFDAVDHIGAVESEAEDWTDGWTVWLDLN